MKSTIVLVSSGQPSANPRLVKEAVALHQAGFKVKVIYCPLSPWADTFDIQLFQQYPHIEWLCVGYHPQKQRFGYTYARIRQKYYQLLYKWLGNKYTFLVKSMVLFSQELTKTGCSTVGDLYIGHNLGALPAVVVSAQRNNAKAVFDFEDFHRGEAKENSQHWQRCTQLENAYVPMLHAATTASPLITEAYQQLYPFLKITTINNCFFRSYTAHELPQPSNKYLELFWFSQTIGQNRGLEQVIKALGLAISKNIRLTLLGNCSNAMRLYFTNLAAACGLDECQLHFLAPVSEKALVHQAAQCHVGIASELPTTVNRDLCLTNKIFIYLLAGNAILFSQTKAQVNFWKQHPEIGNIYPQDDAQSLAELLNTYVKNIQILQIQRKASFELAQSSYHWEKEKKQLIELVQLLGNN